MTIGNALGFAALFLMLIAATDIPMTAPLAAVFAWLLLVAFLLKYGPDAFNTIAGATKGPKSTAQAATQYGASATQHPSGATTP